MRILHVVPSYLPATRYGGPIYSVHALCVALVERGHHVEVFTTNVDGPGVSDVPVSQAVYIDGVKVTYFEASIGRRIYRSSSMGAALTTRVSSFDVVHLHSVFLWPTSAAAAQARKCGVPYVLAPRGMLVRDLISSKSSLLKSVWIRLFERRNLANASAIHVTSKVEADEITALGLPMPHVAVMPNGVEVPDLSCNSELTDDAGSLPHPLILSLGRISWKKGLDSLIKALAHVPDATLVIAGNDEENYTSVLHGIASQLQLTDRIKFIGPIYGDAKWRLIKHADVFVLPSKNENFGNAVLEAMACGVPVIVTPGVGLASIIEAANAGLVCSDDPPELGRNISMLLADRDRRRSMGDRGKALARANFTWDAIALQAEGCYQRVVNDA
jgi:glycosyltransferase involved in cell wall biosynthesis